MDGQLPPEHGPGTPQPRPPDQAPSPGPPAQAPPPWPPPQGWAPPPYSPRKVLAAFEAALRLLHPVMPFLTEELWQRLETGRKSIALEPFPQYLHERSDLAAEHEMQVLQDIVSMARNLRAEKKVSPKLPLTGTLYTQSLTVGALAAAHVEAEGRPDLASDLDQSPGNRASHSAQTGHTDLHRILPIVSSTWIP